MEIAMTAESMRNPAMRIKLRLFFMVDVLSVLRIRLSEVERT
jgi:hypothetical protein